MSFSKVSILLSILLFCVESLYETDQCTDYKQLPYSQYLCNQELIFRHVSIEPKVLPTFHNFLFLIGFKYPEYKYVIIYSLAYKNQSIVPYSTPSWKHGVFFYILFYLFEVQKDFYPKKIKNYHIFNKLEEFILKNNLCASIQYTYGLKIVANSNFVTKKPSFCPEKIYNPSCSKDGVQVFFLRRSDPIACGSSEFITENTVRKFKIIFSESPPKEKKYLVVVFHQNKNTKTSKVIWTMTIGKENKITNEYLRYLIPKIPLGENGHLIRFFVFTSKLERFDFPYPPLNFDLPTYAKSMNICMDFSFYFSFELKIVSYHFLHKS